LGVFAVTWIGIRNRTREVGTRRAIGATRQDVLIQFFAEGTIGALIGCGSGLAISYIALRIIDNRIGQPLMLSTRAVFDGLLVSMTLYVVFTLVSSFRAIRIEPSVSLRAE
jgi:putative ABC transport system permease protein